MSPGPGAHIWIAAGRTDMQRVMHGFSALVQIGPAKSPFSGKFFVFRGPPGDLIRILWCDGDGHCLVLKKLERGRIVWPQAESGAVSLVRAHRNRCSAETHDRCRTAAGGLTTSGDLLAFAARSSHGISRLAFCWDGMKRETSRTLPSG
jgi:transposase